MHKKSQETQKWTKHHFKLAGNALYYYDYGSMNPKNEIFLNSALMIVPSCSVSTQALSSGILDKNTNVRFTWFPAFTYLQRLVFDYYLDTGEVLDKRAFFEIHTKTEKVYLNAPTEREMDTWIENLSNVKRKYAKYVYHYLLALWQARC